jgi:hypothetical protein
VPVEASIEEMCMEEMPYPDFALLLLLFLEWALAFALASNKALALASNDAAAGAASMAAALEEAEGGGFELLHRSPPPPPPPPPLVFARGCKKVGC